MTVRTTMTYSILGCDTADGASGVAVQSTFPGVGSLVPYGEADVGVVATQGFGNPRHGSTGLTLLRCGATPRQALDVLLDDDPASQKRQFALVQRVGTGAAHTGADLPIDELVRCYGPTCPRCGSYTRSWRC